MNVCLGHCASRTQRGWKKLICPNKCTPCHVFLGESDGVFSHHCFASRCVRGDKHRVVSLQPQHSLFLEDIQLKGPLQQRRGGQRDRSVLTRRSANTQRDFNAMIHHVYRETHKQRGGVWSLHIKKDKQITYKHMTGWLLEYTPWKLDWGCVYRNHHMVKLYWQGWPIFYFPLASFLLLISHLFPSLGETRMTRHPEDRDFSAV